MKTVFQSIIKKAKQSSTFGIDSKIQELPFEKDSSFGNNPNCKGFTKTHCVFFNGNYIIDLASKYDGLDYVTYKATIKKDGEYNRLPRCFALEGSLEETQKRFVKILQQSLKNLENPILI